MFRVLYANRGPFPAGPLTRSGFVETQVHQAGPYFTRQGAVERARHIGRRLPNCILEIWSGRQCIMDCETIKAFSDIHLPNS
jgi:hypothetical protein